MIIFVSSTVREERRMEVEMDTEVEEPPDQLTKHPAFECFSRMIKIEVKQVRNLCVYSRPGDRVWP